KGKGYGDCGNMGIIKANICQWLQNSPYVLAYHTAQGKHGGSGAVYVLMRKNKHK
ncbi:MAG: Smr/MutS family protein, partial [Pseudomonadota bacterium]|nr:Smr/MutS family protein [Pseudomonadota bacterium]